MWVNVRGALTIAADSVALTTDTTGNYVTNITASNGLQATAAAGEGTTPNLVLGGILTGATTFTQGTHNVLFDLTSTGIFSVLAGANGLSISNLGVTTLSSAVLTTADINSGTLDGVTIGATTRDAASFTTVSATSAAIAGTVSAGTVLTSNILGGTTTTSGLTLKTTSGVGTTTADMHFLVGNNGATEAMTILNNGNVGIGIATPVSALQVNGGIQMADDASTCPGTGNAKVGTLRINAGTTFQVCLSSGWTTLSTTSNNVVTGTYTGDGNASQSINLGFRPKMVIAKGITAPYYAQAIVIDGISDASNQLRSYESSNAGVTANLSNIKITNTGFDATGVGNSSDLNFSTGVYYYVAIGTDLSSASQWTTNGSDIYYTNGSVGIGNTNPSPAAILQVDSTTKGVLGPRMTTTQRKAISSPPEGLEVYDTDAHAKLYYNGTMWLEVGGDPIGTIKAWHKSFTNTPSLAWGWVECSGQTLSDSDSLYDGQVIPNLNGTPTSGGSGYTGGGRFLRGGTTSGTFQDGTTFLRHSNGTDPHSDLPENHDGEDTSVTGNSYGYDTPLSSTTDFRKYYVRPVNMTVVWIMKIK